MKSKFFKIREIDGEVVKNLTDKQAGELYKAICAYNFHNREYAGKDETVKTVFTLMKNEFEKDRFFKETGKLGGVKKAPMKREDDSCGPCIARAVIGGDIVEEMLKGICGEAEKPEKIKKAVGLENATNSAKM